MVSEPRKSWYGDGQQPWDDILAAGWAPEFAAGNVIKYLRRTKDPAHSLESARWYWARLGEMKNAKYVLGTLRSMLSSEEIAKLENIP